MKACALAKSFTATLSTEGPGSFAASAAASADIGYSNPVPRQDLHPLKIDDFFRRIYNTLLLGPT